ncbi:MAG: hypothetical protein FK732_09470, partial [Asgard group archaeon]|nr:hypothetical protein [Asgard group archaeon]
EILTKTEKEVSLLDNLKEFDLQFYKAKVLDLRSSFELLECRYEKAVQMLEESLNYKKKLDDEIEIANTLYRYGLTQILNNENEEAKNKLLQAVEYHKKTENIRGLIYSYHNLGWAYDNLLESNKSKESFKLCYETSKEFGNRYDLFWGLHGLTLFTLKESGTHKALENHLQALEIANEFENDYIRIITNTDISVFYHILGRPKLAISHIEASIELFRNTYNNRPTRELSWVYRQAGVAYVKGGDIALGKDYFEKAIANSRCINDEYGVSYGLFYLSSTYSRRGELDQALKCLNESNELAQKRKDERLYSWNARQYGQIYRKKGELQKAIDHITDYQDYCEKIGLNDGIVDSYYDFANVYFEKGDLDEALDNALKVYEAHKEPIREQRFAEIIFFLVRLLIERNELDKAQLYVNELEELNKAVSDVIINQRHQTASALFLKTGLRAANRAKAESLLKAVVEEEIVRVDITIVALINLCELLLEEFRLTSDLSVLEELETYAVKLVDNALMQDSILLKLEAQHIRILSLWLQAQHSISEININEIQSLLKNTQELAELKGLFGLAQRIFSKHNKILENLEIWADFLQSYYNLIKYK